jgi:predicted dehydrogenase
MTLRVGLFGAGWAARTVHGPSLRDYRRRRGGITLAAVCDLNAERAAEVAAEFGFHASYTSVADTLERARLDAAVLAVSIPQNAKVGGACLEAGLPILLEKPPALTRRAVQALAETVKRTRGRAMVAFNRRWTPVLVRLRKLVAAAGPIHSIRCDMRRVRRQDPDFSTTAVHAIDAMRFLTGRDYASLRVAYGHCGPTGQAATIHALGTLDGGAVAQLDVTPMAGMEMEQYTVHAAGRTFVAELGLGKVEQRLTVFADGERREVAVRTPSAARHDMDGFYQEVAAFLEAVKKGGAMPGPTVGQTAQSVAVMAAISKGRSVIRC